MSKKSSPTKFIEKLSSKSQEGYRYAIKKYEKLNNASIDELIEEALNEQDEGVPTHRLSIIERLETFQEFLIEKNMTYGSIQLNLTLIKTVYRRNRVNLPYIENVDPKRCRKRDYIEYKDILTKDEIKQALSHMRPPQQARAMVMALGGLSNEECEHLTTKAFIDELQPYHKKTDDVEALKWLMDEKHPVIWVTKLVRKKTGKPYYAVIGAEAVNKIAEAKLYEKDLPRNKGEIPSKLLDINKMSFTHLCRRINDKLEFGLVAEESKFRPHMLRKFHATKINGSIIDDGEQYHLTNSEIDELQGRGKTNVQDTYIKSNPLEQKMIYAKVMNNLALYHEYDYEIVDGDVLVYLKDQLAENRKLKKQIQSLKNNNQLKKSASVELENIKEMIGEDNFNEVIAGILNPQ